MPPFAAEERPAKVSVATGEVELGCGAPTAVVEDDAEEALDNIEVVVVEVDELDADAGFAVVEDEGDADDEDEDEDGAFPTGIFKSTNAQ